MSVYLVIGILLTLVYLFDRIKNHKRHVLAKSFPGPPSFPIIGSAYIVLFPRKPEENIQFLNEARKRYGGIFRVWIGLNLVFLVNDYKISELVLSSSTNHLKKNNLYDLLVPWLGDGLLMSKGKKWHSRRKIITPAFHFSILEQFVGIFNKESQVLVKQLEKHLNGEVFDMHDYISLMALDIICETAMGTQVNAQTQSESAYVKAVHDIAKILSRRMEAIWLRSEFVYSVLASSMKKKQYQAIETMHNFSQGIIKKRREQLLNSKPSEKESGRKEALLDVLLQSTINGKPLTNSDIQEEVDTFMFEGHDTTTSGISYTLQLLSRHKDVQDKVFAEIKEVLGTDKNGDTVNYRTLQELKYLELVLKESMRLYPPVPVIGRTTDADVKIDEKRTIPEGSSFTINFREILRDPDVFENPDSFIPERFSVESTIERTNAYAYTPFSAGSRNCIGQKFAMLEMKSTISKILRHYELLPIGEEPINVMELVMRSANGIQMGIKPRVY